MADGSWAACRAPSVVIGDFDIVEVAAVGEETHPVLVADPDAPLPLAVASQPLQAIARQGEVLERSGRLQLRQLAAGDTQQFPRQRLAGVFRIRAIEDVSGTPVLETSDHGSR